MANTGDKLDLLAQFAQDTGVNLLLVIVALFDLVGNVVY
jgi:hypothetical protein